MDTTTATQPQTIPAVVPGLAAEVVDALFPQWSVNGHDVALAFETVAEHDNPAVREAATTTPLTAVLQATLEAEFWQRARAERQAQAVR